MKHQARIIPTFALFLLLAAPITRAQIQLTYDQQVHNFGYVGIDYVVQHTFKLPNIGKTPVRLTKLEVNCDCTAARILDSVIPPGDTGRISLAFTTKNYYGPSNKSIKVYTDNKQSPSVELYYVAVVGQWFDGIKPNPISLFFLPGKVSQQFEIISTMHDRAEVDSVRMEDTLFTVKPVVTKVGKNEKFVFQVIPNPNLAKGTYLGDFAVFIRFDKDEKAEPTILSTPVKIVRF